LAVSAVGCALGAIQGFLLPKGGFPASMLATAYGVNALTLGGLYFALRGGALVALSQHQQRPPLPSELLGLSGGVGGLLGAAVWGTVGGGLRRAPMGAALLAGLGVAGQLAYDAIEGELVASGGGQVLGAGDGSSSSSSSAGPSGAAAPWSNVPWLPVSLSSTASDEARLRKERLRLAELEQVLGITQPVMHPMAVELARREQAALRAIEEHTAGSSRLERERQQQQQQQIQ
jgi:hypothetical protein